jgi:protein ImuA
VSSPSPYPGRRALVERLRAELARIDGARAGEAGVLPLGLPALDGALPGGGLACGAVHEIAAEARHGAAAAGFAALLLARFAERGAVAWIGRRLDLYAPGLAELGLDPRRLIAVRARRREERLWVLEEVLRTPGIAAGLAEIDLLDLTASRRLLLAAEAKGVSGLLLRPAEALAVPSAALTRWRVAALPGAGGRDRRGPPRLAVELVRARGGQEGAWAIEWRGGGWHEVADPLAVAADAAHRPPGAAREA